MHAMMNEAARREFFEDLLEAAAAALCNQKKLLAPDEIEQVRRARNTVLLLAGKLVEGANLPAALIVPIIEAAYVIGKYCVVTPPVKKSIARETAEYARDKRSQTPKEIALRDAIKAEHAHAPMDLTRPYATAEAIVDGVNARLEAAAKTATWTFKPIKSKALGDRLKRLRDEGFFVLGERN
jgi:hypothetical protein